MPPRTVATKETISGSSPIPGVTDAVRPSQNRETMPARRPLMAKAVLMIRFAGTPSIRVMVNLSAAARSAMPRIVLRRTKLNRASMARLTTMASTSRTGTSVPPIAMLSEKRSGSGTTRARGDTNRSAAQQVKCVARDHDELAIGEIDEAQDAVDDHEA